MTEIDHDLKRRLIKLADEIQPDGTRGPLVLERARIKRRLVATISGLGVLLLIGGIAGASVLWQPEETQPAPAPKRDETFARYFFEAAKEDMAVSGVLEVNSEDDTLCLEGTFSDNIKASHLLWRTRDPGADGPRIQEVIAVTFFDPSDDEVGASLPRGAAVCFAQDQLGVLNGEFEGENLQALIDNPEQFRLDFHRGPNDDPGLVTELRESPGPAWTPLSQPPIETQGYVFSNLETRFRQRYDDPTAGRVKLQGDIDFRDGFPGTRECTFRLYDSSGGAVGSATIMFTAAGPSSGTIVEGIDVRGVPASVDVRCSQDRFDDPQGTFSFGEVTLEPDPTAGDRAFRARSRYVWSGEGTPTPQRCTLRLFDAAGNELFEAKGSLIAADGTSHFMEFAFELSEEVAKRFATGEVVCRPIP